MVKSEPKKKPQFDGFFQKFFRKPERNEKEQRLTVQRSIPYLEMGRDGICRVEEHLYSKTVRFYDINYQLAQNEDKNTIFESWCDFLNYFDASIRFQLSFINHKSDMSEYNKVIQIEPQHDAFDDVRMEYAQMLKQQLAKGNNGLVRTKYITFSIEAKSVREAKPRLERIETDILNNFKVLGVKAYPLNGVERLQIMYETFHQEEQQKFDFSYDRILQSGMTTKDFISPTSFLFKSGKDFMMGDTYGAASYLNILAPELTDKVLAEFLDMDKNLVVSIHVQSVDQLKAIKLIKGKITDLDRMKIEEQKKAVRSGYDMEIIPSDLATYGGEAKKILDDLQSRNERMFLVTVLFLNTAKTKQELDSAVFQTAGIAQKFNCTLNRLDYLQEQGLMSSLPLANNLVPIKRALTTTSTAIFVPFTTQELFMEGDSLYYGLNAVSNNMIMADRKQLKNPNGLILGTPGSGKSFSAKREITNVFFTTTDDIIVADPEGEYYPLVEALGGQVIHISSTSKQAIHEAIADNYDGMYLGDGAVDQVVRQYGMERVGYILANTLHHKSYDGRFSHSNKEWSEQVSTPEHNADRMTFRTDWVVDSHPAILDGFVTMFRKELEAQKEQEQPFVKQFYVVENLQAAPLKIERFGNLDDAMSQYQALPNHYMKSLGVEKNPDPMPGSLDVLQCKNGLDTIVEDYKTVPGWDNPYIQNHVVQPLQGALAVQDVELAYELPDAYFHIQTCDDGFDYTLYNKDFTERDGGVLETDGDKPVQEAMTELLAEFGCDAAQGRIMDAAELREQADTAAEQQAEVLKEKLAAERPAPEETLSFYVAECLEFTFAGEFHDHLTMEEALEAYDKIPSERMNADKCIGFCIEEDGGFVGMYEMVVNDKVQRENINSINYFRDDKLVQQAISDMEKLMAARQQSKEQERGSTKKSVLDALRSLKAKKQEQPAQEQDKPKKAKKKGMEL